MPPLLALFPAAAAGAGTAVAGGTTAAAVGGTALMEGLAVGTAGITATAIPATFASTIAPAVAGLSSWLSPLMTAASIGGLGLSVMGQIQQGQTEADIMEANAKAGRLEGKSIQEAAKAESLKVSRERNQMIGTQAALFGASGVDLSSGSPLDVMAQTARSYEEDIQNLGYAGDTRAATKLYQSDIYDWMAPQKRRAGWIGAAGTALGGMSALARMKKYGF